jgi:hypothetical protein
VAGVLRHLHQVCVMPWQCRVASETHVSIGTWVKAKYFSHCLSQLTSSSPEKVGKSSLGRAMERLNFVLGCLLGGGGFSYWNGMVSGSSGFGL